MTPRLLPLYVLAGALLGAWGGYAAKGGGDSVPGTGSQSSKRNGRSVTPATEVQSASVAAQLDQLAARVKALAERDPHPGLCESACLAGVQSVVLRRGLVSCRCRTVPRLAVYRGPEAGR